LLFVTDKKAQTMGRLAGGEYEELVAAFAQAGAMPGERGRGAAVVRKYQQRRRWFGCDCLGAGAGAWPVVGRPGLVPARLRTGGVRAMILAMHLVLAPALFTAWVTVDAWRDLKC
jgi:hypothetical protein